MNFNFLWDELVEKRNNKLFASDWTQIPDSPLTAEKKTEWATYRQALRDVPNNLRNHENYVSDEESNPYDLYNSEQVFPTKPED
tara:strand:- start:39 stop:290 length:252 start_codon:yes stop_codon:yes gene_type:complete